MAMFGGAAPGRNWADMVMLIGAGLKDASSGGSENLTNVMQLQGARQKQAQQMALAQKAMGLFGGQAAQLKPDAPSVEAMANGVMAGDPNAPTLDQVQARDPAAGMPSALDAARQLAELQAMGLDTAPYQNLFKLAQPEIQFAPSGEAVNTRDPGMVGKVFPGTDKGEIVIRDANGNPTGIMLMPGKAEAVGALEGAKTAGQRDAAFVDVPLADGRTIKMTGADYLKALGDNSIPGLGVRPSEAQIGADKIVANAGAGAITNLPQTLDSGRYMLGLIESLKNDPALGDRTGWMGKLPALPDTPGVAFDAKVAQLKGNTFMQAYQSLKGGGQITEVEGRKAEDAIARLDRAQSSADFVQALDDLAGVVRTGLDRAQTLAQMGPAASGGGQRQAPMRAINPNDYSLEELLAARARRNR